MDSNLFKKNNKTTTFIWEGENLPDWKDEYCNIECRSCEVRGVFGSTFSDWKRWNKWGKFRRWLRFHQWDVVFSSMILSEFNEQNLTSVSYNNTMLISIVYYNTLDLSPLPSNSGKWRFLGIPSPTQHLISWWRLASWEGGRSKEYTPWKKQFGPEILFSQKEVGLPTINFQVRSCQCQFQGGYLSLFLEHGQAHPPSNRTEICRTFRRWQLKTSAPRLDRSFWGVASKCGRTLFSHVNKQRD